MELSPEIVVFSWIFPVVNLRKCSLVDDGFTRVRLGGICPIGEDGSLSIELRVTPSGERVRNSFTLRPGEPDYDRYREHLGPDLQEGPRYGIRIFPSHCYFS